MSVMLTVVKRDRDNVVTNIPVLIPAARGEKRDGWITRDETVEDEEGSAHQVHDLTVRMVPFAQISALLSGQAVSKGTAWQLSQEEKRKLLRLATLVEGAVTRNQSRLQLYIKMESDSLFELAEINRWNAADRRRVALTRAQNAFRTIGNEVNRNLGRVRFVIWWVEEQRHFAPGLLCRDLPTALTALLVSRITASQNFAVCALPSCRRQFVRVKKNNHYCSRKCGDTHRKQLQRARLRRRQKKGKDNGTL
jgi:hypothetical protein